MKYKVGDIVMVSPNKIGRSIYHNYDMVVIRTYIEMEYDVLKEEEDPQEMVTTRYTTESGEEVIENWHSDLVVRTRSDKIKRFLADE